MKITKGMLKKRLDEAFTHGKNDLSNVTWVDYRDEIIAKENKRYKSQRTLA